MWWVESDNRVVNTYLVSGRSGTPAYGTYHVYSKSRYTTSLDGSARMEYMVRFAWGRSAAIGFHSIPVNRYGTPLQSESQLGTPLSAGCVRQRWWDAAGSVGLGAHRHHGRRRQVSDAGRSLAELFRLDGQVADRDRGVVGAG